MKKAAPTGTTTPQLILDVAERLAQTSGFNGFSYADIAEAIGITKASLHYHFPTKAELGRRLVVRYCESFGVELAAIESATPDAPGRLRRYAKLFVEVLRGNRMCLCGMLAAEQATLPEPMRRELRRFFDVNERWLARVLAEGRRAGELAFKGSHSEVARLLMGSLEGTMLVAHAYDDVARFESSVQRLIAALVGPRAVDGAGGRAR
jgi:TetR/AcrR family transcriptional repressor of nem operon